MGEYADMAIDDGFAHWDSDEPDDDFRTLRRRLHELKTCNRCGARGLFWRPTEAGWRLFAISNDDPWDEEQHVCASVPPVGG